MSLIAAEYTLASYIIKSSPSGYIRNSQSFDISMIIMSYMQTATYTVTINYQDSYAIASHA